MQRNMLNATDKTLSNLNKSNILFDGKKIDGF